MPKMQNGHIKTYNASLGTGYVELVSSGESLRFDAQAISPGAESVRSGDEVLVQASKGKVAVVTPIDEDRGSAMSSVPEFETSVATVKVDGDTPARFNRLSFARTAARLDFADS